jgi:hypothetical protein
MDNYTRCLEWLNTIDVVVAKYYEKNANVELVNNQHIMEAIKYAFVWADTPHGHNFWLNLNDRWEEYLKNQAKVNPCCGHDKETEKEEATSVNPSHYNSDKSYDVYSFAIHNALYKVRFNALYTLLCIVRIINRKTK